MAVSRAVAARGLASPYLGPILIGIIFNPQSGHERLARDVAWQGLPDIAGASGSIHRQMLTELSRGGKDLKAFVRGVNVNFASLVTKGDLTEPEARRLEGLLQNLRDTKHDLSKVIGDLQTYRDELSGVATASPGAIGAVSVALDSATHALSLGGSQAEREIAAADLAGFLWGLEFGGPVGAIVGAVVCSLAEWAFG
ncbi:MAG TPA: hypothetical protein VJB57_19860 [Dehalococcoidia bacterium]|nr:hypothetical protein [Dehalococcoidia bacterium]